MKLQYRLLIAGIIIIILLRTWFLGMIYSLFVLAGRILGALNFISPTLSWCVGGLLIGATYGSFAAVKKYNLNRNLNLLPIGALALFVIISLLIQR